MPKGVGVRLSSCARQSYGWDRDLSVKQMPMASLVRFQGLAPYLFSSGVEHPVEARSSLVRFQQQVRTRKVLWGVPDSIDLSRGLRPGRGSRRGFDSRTLHQINMDAWKTKLPQTFAPRSLAQQVDMLKIRLAELKIAVVEAAEDVETALRRKKRTMELVRGEDGSWKMP